MCYSSQNWKQKHCTANTVIILSSDERYRGQSEPAPTRALTWMDGALIGFSFLSLCHPTLTFFVCPFSALISVFFFFELYFLPAPHPVSFFFSFETFPARPSTSPHCPSPTYSPIYLKCATLIFTHLPPAPAPIYLSTYLPIHLPTYQHFKYVPTKPHLHGYTYLHGCHSIDPQQLTTMKKE